MKKYLLLVLSLVCAASLRAQIVGDVNVTRRELAQRDGMLCMTLDITVSRDAIPRSESWMIIPELSTFDRASVKVFPHVLVVGPYQRHMLERRRRLVGAYWAERQPYAVIRAEKETERTISYEMKVPYEAWMSDATLVLRQIQTTPGGRRRVFTVDVNGAVDRER